MRSIDLKFNICLLVCLNDQMKNLLSESIYLFVRHRNISCDHYIWRKIRHKYFKFGMLLKSWTQHTKLLVKIGLSGFELDWSRRKLLFGVVILVRSWYHHGLVEQGKLCHVRTSLLIKNTRLTSPSGTSAKICFLWIFGVATIILTFKTSFPQIRWFESLHQFK